jgi:uncharacterized protein
LEVHADNYMGARDPPHAQLARLREDYSLSIHGAGMSIGSMRPLDQDYLAQLKVVCDRYESFSEKLAWSSHDTVFLNDLLPLPYTKATLQRVVKHIDQVQSFLRRQMLLENPATYLLFEEHDGLIRALASRFPVTEKIVGEEFFAGMARAFIELHSPRSPQ